MNRHQPGGLARWALPPNPTTSPQAAAAAQHSAPIHTPDVWPFHADARTAVRSRRPDCPAPTAGIRRHGPARSDGRGIDLLETKGVVMVMSDLRRSATHGPRTPAGTDCRGGSRRGAG